MCELETFLASMNAENEALLETLKTSPVSAEYYAAIGMICYA